MVRYVQMVNIDNDKFIAYCSEGDYEYAIHIGDKVFFKTSEEIGPGKLVGVNEKTFVVQNENTKEILFSEVDEIFCEEEMSSLLSGKIQNQARKELGIWDGLF